MTDPAALPAFRYHPDPVDTGSVVTSNSRCTVCKERRGFIYSGPVYAEDDLEEAICPWCIANGSAHRSLGATFVDSEAFPVDTPDEVIGVSGGAATRLLDSLRRDASPTAYLFRCLHCGEPQVHVDHA